MMPDVHRKLNSGLTWQSSFQEEEEEDSVHQQIGLKNKEESSKVLHLDYSFVWC